MTMGDILMFILTILVLYLLLYININSLSNLTKIYKCNEYNCMYETYSNSNFKKHKKSHKNINIYILYLANDEFIKDNENIDVKIKDNVQDIINQTIVSSKEGKIDNKEIENNIKEEHKIE